MSSCAGKNSVRWACEYGRNAGGSTPLRYSRVTTAEAQNLEAISKAIDQHDSNCPSPLVEIQLNPFELERLGWDSIRGLPLVGNPKVATGHFKLVCAGLHSGGGATAEAVGVEVEEPERVTA